MSYATKQDVEQLLRPIRDMLASRTVSRTELTGIIGPMLQTSLQHVCTKQHVQLALEDARERMYGQITSAHAQELQLLRQLALQLQDVQQRLLRLEAKAEATRQELHTVHQDTGSVRQSAGRMLGIYA